jgi:hypothetical protein
MAISYVGVGSDFTSNSSGTGYTINRPASVTTGDLMIAVLALDTYSTTASSVTITNPTGWTTVSTVTPLSYCRFRIMYKFHDGSEPSSWTGSLSAACPHRVSVSVAYRGVEEIGNTSSGTVGSGVSVNSGSASSPSSTSWRISCGAYVSSSVSSTITTTGDTQRANAVTSGGSVPGGVELSYYDSAGTIGVGNTGRTYSRGSSWESAGAWVGILLASSGEAVTGEMDVDLVQLPQFSGAGEVTVEADLEVELPLLEFEGDGIATPPEGTLAIAIPIGVAFVGAQDAAGTLDTVIEPVFDIKAETRFFGVRVIIPERESRVTRPRLGASD